MSQNIFLAGLPSTGKTTFLAALWHLVRAGEIETTLRYDGLQGIDVKYLNEIRTKWLQHEEIGRTKQAQEALARLNLKTADGSTLALAVPDFAGEGFRRMWSTRRATQAIVNSAAQASGHLLLVNVDKIIFPRTVDEHRADLAATGGERGDLFAFDMLKCPTAAILADVLTSLETAPIAAAPPRLAVALTAWDTVAEDQLSPADVLADRLPLVDQMLRARAGNVATRVYGISAQGMAYKHIDPAALPDIPSHRIRVAGDGEEHHDLTKILAWLLE